MVHVLREKRMRESVRIAICDDSPQFTKELKDKIENICAKKDWMLDSMIFFSPRAILGADLSAMQVVFLDIDMPEINGLTVAKELRARYPKMILIFVTAFIEYAPAGYHVAAFRYLLKQKIDNELPAILDDIQQKIHETSDMISIRQKLETICIPLNEIVYLEGTPNRMVLFHIVNVDKPVEAFGKLADYEKLLEKKGFLRLQKSFIANMLYINKISSYQVTLRNGTVIRASEKYYKQVQATFLQWKGQHL